MNKTVSISLRLSSEEIALIKQAAILACYSSYSEFMRRTCLIEAGKIIEKNKSKDEECK